MSLIWVNSTKSVLCDRLLDLFIITSYAKLLNKKLCLKWEDQPVNQIQKKIWNPNRFDDYKIENIQLYFKFSNIINFINNNDYFKKLIDDKNEENIKFYNYLGGVYSPITFYNNFIDKKYKLEDYINIFETLINKFKPSDKLLNLVKILPTNLVSIHLRRTDKSSEFVNANDACGIDIKNIDELNNKTLTLINNFIKNGYNNFYFASDCPETKKFYENLFKKQNIINYKINNKIEQTYLDIYLMSQSKYIILSQKHSSFSLFASLINKATLIFLYNDSIINNANYTYFANILYYDNTFQIQNINNQIQNINNTDCIVYFHQGWTDIFNCLALINYNSQKYKKVYLLIRKDSKDIINFYIKSLKNIVVLYEEKNILDNNNINYFLRKYNIPEVKKELYGFHDEYREDNFKNIFKLRNHFFVNSFYLCYNISYLTRISEFNFERDISLENQIYNKFIEKYGENYI